ncbi:hypothetical protein Taro_012581 [Colocasia esculenta]|uniref:Uncharacterized protein n=1 Tax=Colocasia esculenta TaxID=4460 RepID=A0A843UG49_COLES|nr:hypothetical protein [Colocasia esculenta]
MLFDHASVALLVICSTLLSFQESSILQHLRVMAIEDMIYLIHVDGLAKHALLIPTLQFQLFFVDLEQDPPKMLPFTEENVLMTGLLSIQKLILSVLPLDEVNKSLSSSVPSRQAPSGETSTCKQDEQSSAGEHIFLQSSEFIDLSSCMQDANVTIPTLNGKGASGKKSKEELMR